VGLREGFAIAGRGDANMSQILGTYRIVTIIN